MAERFLSHEPGRVALITGGGSTTYGELYDRSARWRGGLRAAGVGPGDAVAVISGNDDTFVLAHLAVIGAGAVTVPLNPQSPPAALARELELVAPAAAVVGPAGRAAWDGLAGSAPAGSRPKVVDAGELDRSDPQPVTAVDPWAPAALVFTSGTAGFPKPAVLTHRNFEASLDAVFSLPIGLRQSRHVVLAAIPLFHIFGLNIVLNLGLEAGATLVLDDQPSPARVGELVATHGVTLLCGPPTLWRALAHSEEVRPEQLRTLQLAVSGAAKLAPEIRLAVGERLGIDVVEGYGLTETCAVAATAVGAPAPVGTVGRLLPGVEARIVGADGEDVLVGDPGELWLRGPMISPGYVTGGREEAGAEGGTAGTRARTADGWLRTGDVAVVDDGGNLAIVDRSKDVVIVSGFNVLPGEVEAVLAAHPDVAAAGVVGQPDPVTGEALIAHVVPRDGVDRHDLDQAPELVSALIEHCRQQLARYKVPKRIELRDQLPSDFAGKLRRREL